MEIAYQYISTPFGKLKIVANKNAIVQIDFLSIKPLDLNEQPNHITKFAVKEISEFILRKRKKFTVPVDLHGTEFQMKVWNALMEIPYGEIRSYKDLAIKIKSEKAYRAVGMTNSLNPIPLIVPCHRVIGASGKLVGFSGGLELKKALLNFEGHNFI